MHYDQYCYLWPPRPERAQGANLLHTYERQRWWAQAKMNGQCLVLAISPEREIIARGRHGDEAPKLWCPGENLQRLADQLPGRGWHVLVCELLHTKGVGVKDTVYLHDILVDDGDYLIGVPMRDRQRRLHKLVHWPFALHAGPNSDPGDWSHTEFPYLPGIWLTINHHKHFRALYDQRPGPYVEGLVLKDPDAPLALCSKAGRNSEWQAKCRYPNNMLSF